ncbi:MAG: DUF2817 domain-containing protein [Gemmataceae bacterium]
MMDLAAYFSPDYVTARDRFRRLAAERGAAGDVLPICGDDLTADAATFGDVGAAKVIVASSGLHGAEGFFGSAVQLAWLDALSPGWRPPAGVAVVLLHALNPFGFAHVRRGNEDGVDLHRNFLRPGEEYRGCPVLYADLDPLLNPPRPPRFDFFCPRMYLARFRHGSRALRGAIAAGQYEYPKGLFFGGHSPSATMRAFEAYLPRWLDPAERVLHLDFHTGLGTYASHRILSSQPTASASAERLRSLYGSAVETLDTGATAYSCRGSIDEWVEHRWAGRTVDSVCAEFGTYGPLAVLAAARAENQAHHWSNDPMVKARTKQRMAEAFAPADPVWRQAVVRQGVDLIRRACDGV